MANQTIKQKLDSIHSYHWDEENLKWNFSSRVQFIYDNHRNIMQELNFEWNEGKMQWVHRWKITFSYNDNRHLSQRLYYEWSTTLNFELFNLQGQKIISKNISKGEQLDLEVIKPGIYIYSIQTRDKRHKGKLIKE